MKDVSVNVDVRLLRDIENVMSGLNKVRERVIRFAWESAAMVIEDGRKRDRDVGLSTTERTEERLQELQKIHNIAAGVLGERTCNWKKRMLRKTAHASTNEVYRTCPTCGFPFWEDGDCPNCLIDNEVRTSSLTINRNTPGPEDGAGV